MHRIDTKTAQKDKFGAGKNGFTRGNPQTGTPATDLDDDYFDMLQEELCSVVEASGASLEKGRNDQLLTALRALLLSRKNPFGDIKSDGTVKTALENLGLGEGSALPVGVPVPWPSATPPTGWLKCNGAAFSAEEYPELAKAYPTNKLPDLRGEFIRGWDDGRGMDTGRAILSAQGDAIRNIYGEFKTVNTENYSIWESVGSFKGAVVPLNPSTNNSYFSLVRSMVTERSEGGVYPKVIGLDASRIVPTANENRPRNIAFNYIVRAA
ncbi:phage Tail Collar domain protein [Escherichia coli 3-267-03_S4_C2]|uniref:phage tail protein n=1 Tax=Escherichia coli TaxID=562 RepID=UPI0004D4BE68|nr:phage tail protein [Escherichia coli]EFH6666287.1 integrase [Escherichia coli]EKG6930261.1 tail fiber protein [Escherichia coli]KDU16158.1 phage Tail Collar domain protein [Escherichia coli 3-267-03_S4_C2]KEL69807.1 phage Tail Collar domain protein [Escherichia coli 5-366-08_S3_C2]PPE07844.1 integrase [Escherichia coli]